MTGLAVVSGGGTGIGAATARVLVEDGYRVVIVGRRASVLDRTAAQLGAAGGAVTAIAADLAEPEQVRRMLDEIGDGPVDVLVNNAGGYRAGPAAESPAELAAWWRANLDANVITSVLLTEGLRARLRRPGGRVILFSSIAAQRGGGGPYSAAKAALHGYGYDLAKQLGPDGITVNVISPGYVAGTEFFGDRMTPEGHASRVGQTLVGRAGTPEDIAAAVRYLASPRAGYVTGQVIGVNGGSVLGR